jgi:hypothetical protein
MDTNDQTNDDQTNDQAQDGQDQGQTNAQEPAKTQEPAKPGRKAQPAKPAAAAAKAPTQPAAAEAPVKVAPDANGRKDAQAVDLLLEACDLFGVNPDPDVRPVELLSWRYYPADRRTDTPAKVVIVTAGGQKLGIWEDPDVPLEADTEETLRNIFGAFDVDPVTKAKVPGQLPPDLTLPRTAVTGISDRTDHVYKGGYLRSGGRREGARRQAARR